MTSTAFSYLSVVEKGNCFQELCLVCRLAVYVIMIEFGFRV